MSNKRVILENVDSKERKVNFASNWLMGCYEPATIQEQLSEVSVLPGIDVKIFELRESLSSKVSAIKEGVKSGDLTIEQAYVEFSKIRKSVREAVARNEGFAERVIGVVNKCIKESKVVYEINAGTMGKIGKAAKAAGGFIAKHAKKVGDVASKPIKSAGQKLYTAGSTKAMRSKSKVGDKMMKAGRHLSTHAGKYTAGAAAAGTVAAGAAGKKLLGGKKKK